MPIIDGINNCEFTIEQEIIAIEAAGIKEERKKLKRMKSCLVYLINCHKELDYLKDDTQRKETKIANEIQKKFLLQRKK